MSATGNLIARLWWEYKGYAARMMWVVLAIAATAVPSSGQTVIGTITRPGMVPSAVAVYETGNKVFVADETTGYVYVYNGTTLEELGSVNVGGPVGRMVVNEAYGKLYATVGTALANAKVVAVNAAAGTLIGDVVTCDPFCANLIQLAHDPGLGKVYAVSLLSLIQVDVATDTRVSVTLDSASYAAGSLAVNPVTHEVFIGPTTYNVSLQVVNGSTLAKTTAPVVGSFWGLGVNWIENKVYRADASGGPYTVLDRDTNSVSDIGCNNDAVQFGFNPTNNKMYTSSEIDGFASIIDGSTDACLNLGVPGFMMGFRLSTNHVYYAEETDIAVIDGTTELVETIPISNPSPSSLVMEDVAVNQTTGRVFIINDGNALAFVTVLQDTPILTHPPVLVGAPNSDEIFTIDSYLNSVVGEASYSSPIPSQGLAVRPGGGRLYTGAYDPSSFINSATDFYVFKGVPATSQLGPVPSGGSGPNVPVVSPDASRIYITNTTSNNVGVINTADNSVVTAVPVGVKPWGIAIHPDGSKVYAANRTDNTVSVISTATNTVTATIPVGTAPWGVAVNPSGTKAYVANSGSSTISVINTATDSVIGSPSVGTTPHWLTVSPDGARVYVTNNGADTVSVIETGTDSVIQTVPVGSKPEGLAVLPDGSAVYVANSNPTGASTVSVINPLDYTVTTIDFPTPNPYFLPEATPVAIPDPTSKFAGRVTKAGAPLAGVLVRAMQGVFQKGIAITDAAGDYSVFNLVPGTYNIEFDPPGCNTHSLASQSVGAGRTTVLHSAFTPGECAFPEVQLSRDSVSFGTQKVSILSGTQSVTLTNAGGGDIHVSSFNISGAHAGDFSRTHNCGAGDLTPGGHCSITITFTPTAAGPRKAVLSLPSNAAGSPHEIILTGVGTTASATPSPLNFSSRQVSTTSPASAVTLTNAGPGALRVWTTVVSGSNSGDFARISSCPIPPATLASLGTCTINVTFTPTATGARSGQLQISHDGGASPLIVPLTGTGQSTLAPSVAEGTTKTAATTATSAMTETNSAEASSGVVTPGSTVLSASVSLSATTLKFGAQAVGTSDSPQGLVLRNSGSVPLMIGKIEIKGTSDEDFVQTNNCGTTLGAGQSCTLRVAFTPQRRGARTAILNIVDSSNEGRHEVRLEGVGQKSHSAQRSE